MTIIHDDPIDPQTLLPGFRKHIGWPKRDYRAWRDTSGARVDAPKYRGPTSYGKIVAPPTWPDGHDVESGDFCVFMRTDGLYVVMDRKAKIGDFSTSPVVRNFDLAVETMFRFDRARRCVGPLAPVFDRRGKRVELGELVVWKRADGAFIVRDRYRVRFASHRLKNAVDWMLAEHGLTMPK